MAGLHRAFPRPPRFANAVAALIQRLTGVDPTQSSVCRQDRMPVVAAVRSGAGPIPALDTSWALPQRSDWPSFLHPAICGGMAGYPSRGSLPSLRRVLSHPAPPCSPLLRCRAPLVRGHKSLPSIPRLKYNPHSSQASGSRLTAGGQMRAVCRGRAVQLKPFLPGGAAVAILGLFYGGRRIGADRVGGRPDWIAESPSASRVL